MKLAALHFEELSTRQLYEILRSRAEIFLLRQGIVCQDLDGVDYESLHCFFEDNGRVVAYLRAYLTDAGEVRIGRVLSLTHGIGLGSRLMKESLCEIKRKWAHAPITLHAQTQARGFYEKLGFVASSPVFLEEGVEHITMILKNQ